MVTLCRLAKWGLGPKPSNEAIAHEVTLQQNVTTVTNFSEEKNFHHKKVPYGDKIYISSLNIKKILTFSDEI